MPPTRDEAARLLEQMRGLTSLFSVRSETVGMCISIAVAGGASERVITDLRQLAASFDEQKRETEMKAEAYRDMLGIRDDG